ncbi:MAG: hypothetical protein ABFS35_21230 [Bacteroidota bacterium]
MKTKQIIYTALIFIFSINLLSAQEKKEISKPELEKKCNELIVKLNDQLLLAQDDVKLKNLSATEYGKHVAGQFIKRGLVNDFCFNNFSDVCLHPMACLFKTNDYEITEYSFENLMIDEEKFQPIMASEIRVMGQGTDFIIVKYKKPTGSIESDERYAYIKKQEYLDYFNSAMNTIARHIGHNYNVREVEDVAYITISKN